MNNLRRTGRTTRMLKEAIRLSGAGYAVYVVGRTDAHAAGLRYQLDAMNPPENHGIKFESAELLPNLDWRTMRLERAHPNCRALVDHWAIESRYAAMWEMLHAFDTDEDSGRCSVPDETGQT